MRALCTGIGLLLLAFVPAHAECPSAADIDKLAADWLAKAPGKALPLASMDDANCARGKLVERLRASQGNIVGYKAGLTAKAVQERFGVANPVAGILLEKMILADGATVPAAYGARPVWEADMLLVVKDEGLGSAKTPEQALQHIRGWRPFIELPDLVLAQGEKLDGQQLVAINVGARLGVAGAERPLAATPDTVKALADVKITVTDGSGAKLAENTGAATLGNPLNAVVWLAEELGKSGIKFKAGDLISVGSFSPLSPPKPGQAVAVQYEGLGAPATVKVSFQ
jgi:2-keto-4-pentenoate hydratase